MLPFDLLFEVFKPNVAKAPVNIEGPQIESGIDVSQVEFEENPFDVGYEGDGKTLKPGATYGTFGSYCSLCFLSASSNAATCLAYSSFVIFHIFCICLRSSYAS